MKKILLVATGSVAMVKFKKVLNLLQKKYEVKVIATKFTRDNYDGINEIDIELEKTNLNTFPLHIEHAKWADLMVVVPATANTISKFNAGVADNQVLSTLLAARNPILFIPAMNTWMYDAILQRNVVDNLSNLGHFFLGPVIGMLREGESGMGRMVEPETIAKAIDNYFKPNKGKVLIPYGASKVMIDPIRFITNGSTGMMGKILANEFRLNGYEVNLVDIKNYTNKEFVDFANSQDFDIYISPAAFADFDVKKSNNKIRKASINSIALKDNVDVISSIKKANPSKTFFGFKLDNDIDRAKQKMSKLDLDGIVWNDLSSMGSDKVSGKIITKNNSKVFKDISKSELAKMIVEVI